MSAIVIILPIVKIERYDDEPACVQANRENAAIVAAFSARPPRTWPLLVIDNTRRRD